jgi:hypothetical protein
VAKLARENSDRRLFPAAMRRGWRENTPVCRRMQGTAVASFQVHALLPAAVARTGRRFHVRRAAAADPGAIFNAKDFRLLRTSTICTNSAQGVRSMILILSASDALRT